MGDGGDMKHLRTVVILIVAGFSILSTHAKSSATSINLADYWISQGPGDRWDYTYAQPILPNPHFTVAITTVTSGPYSGKYRMGDYLYPDGSTIWRIVSWDADNFLLYYDNQHGAFDPPQTIPIIQPLDQVVANPVGNSYWYFKKQGTFSVPAGTFSDILLKIDLDANFGPNAANIAFGLPPSITYGVTHATWYARRVGELQDTDYDAATGNVLSVYQLKSTNAHPGDRGLPAVLPLLVD